MSAYEILKNRSVTRLCHFTNLARFVHIISSEIGVCATANIDQDIKRETDHARLDGECGYVCCSIEYPNSWFLRKAMERDIEEVFRDWIVLCIDLDVVRIRKIKYSPCNASAGNGNYIYSNEEELDMLFDPVCVRMKRDPQILDCCATDDQAEILIENNIPREMISKIIVGNTVVAAQVYSILKVYGIRDISIAVAPDVLNTNWSRIVRNGKRPEEMNFVPEGEM